jgi:RNA polymerase sigma-70 factor
MEPDWGQAYESARRAWQPVDLDRTTFERHVRERLPAVNGDGLARVIHTTDLYLACACVNGVAGAFEAFERRYLADLGGVLRAIDTQPAFIDEVHQLLSEKLSTSPKLAGYSGSGSLESWVAITAQRAALSLKRHERAEKNACSRAADDASAVAGDPELAFLKERYRREFEEALVAALAVLSERERVVWRLNLVGGASHARIASMYRVNQSTVTRWVAVARGRVWKELRRHLSARLGIASTEVESLVRLVRSDFNVSISRVLGGDSTSSLPES